MMILNILQWKHIKVFQWILLLVMTEKSTVFVLLTDHGYLPKAKKTIIDLRARGQWRGDIILILVGPVNMCQNFCHFYQVTCKCFPEIMEKHELVKRLNYTSFTDSIDGREISKINQWEKLHVFDPFFQKWSQVVFLDAGLRVLDNVHDSILQLDCTNCFMAPDDGGNFIPSPNPDKLFETQVSKTFYKLMIDSLNKFGGIKIMKQAYFLNCIWMYDTSIINTCSKNELISGILENPICLTNEMALMNMYIHFKYNLWKPFPKHVSNSSRILFDWCESNNPEPSNWMNYSFLKYPCTITFEDT